MLLLMSSSTAAATAIRRPLDEILQLLKLLDDARLSGIIFRDFTLWVCGLIRQRRQTVSKTLQLLAAIGRAGERGVVVVIVRSFVAHLYFFSVFPVRALRALQRALLLE